MERCSILAQSRLHRLRDADLSVPLSAFLSQTNFEHPGPNMVYESDFYTTRRYRPSPSVSSYTISSPSRHYVVRDTPERTYRTSEQNYSYSYNSNVDSSSNRYGDPYGPSSRSYTSSESVSRSNTGGPGGYSYSSERSTRSRGDGVPGGYSSSYSSTSSGRLPGGTTYRHYSYRV